MRALLVILATAMSVAASRVAPQPDAVQSWPIRESVFMLVGPGANTTVQVGRDGSCRRYADRCVIGLTARGAPPLVRQAGRFIVNTTLDVDHVGGNQPWPSQVSSPVGTRGRHCYRHGRRADLSRTRIC